MSNSTEKPDATPKTSTETAPVVKTDVPMKQDEPKTNDNNEAPLTSAVQDGDSDVVKLAHSLKEEASKLFKADKFKNALEKYDESLSKFVEAGIDAKQKNQIEKLKQAISDIAIIYVNIALCYFKLDENMAGIYYASQALRYDPKNGKAYYLRGKMKRLSGQLDTAKFDMEQCVQLMPDNAQAKQELELIQKQLAEEEELPDQFGNMNMGMLNPQVMRMIMQMRERGYQGNPSMGNPMMPQYKSPDQIEEEQMRQAIELSIKEEQDRQKKIEEDKKKQQEIAQQQDTMKAFYDEMMKKQKKDEPVPEEDDDEPLYVEEDPDDDGDDGDDNGDNGDDGDEVVDDEENLDVDADDNEEVPEASDDDGDKKDKKDKQ